MSSEILFWKLYTEFRMEMSISRATVSAYNNCHIIFVFFIFNIYTRRSDLKPQKIKPILNLSESVGIDFSLNYSGITVLKDSCYSFYAINREENFTKKGLNFIKDLESTISFQNIFIPKFIESENYEENQVLKLKDIETISDVILNILKEYNINNIKLEGLSYSSLGQRSLDLAGFNYILRYRIYEQFKNLKIIAPTTAKKLAGKGNLNKVGMFGAFVSNVLNDKQLQQNETYLKILNNIEIININNKKIIEPVAGLIDGYFIAHS